MNTKNFQISIDSQMIILKLNQNFLNTQTIIYLKSQIKFYIRFLEYYKKHNLYNITHLLNSMIDYLISARNLHDTIIYDLVNNRLTECRTYIEKNLLLT